MSECKGFWNTLGNTIVFSVDIGEDMLESTPDIVPKVLEQVKPHVRGEIIKFMNAQSKKMLKQGKESMVISKEDMKEVGKNAATSIGKAALKELKTEITGGHHYKQLKKGVKELKCSFENSPVGVFIDKNEKRMIFLGYALVAGGATIMYVQKGGDEVAAPLASLIGKKLRYKYLGKVEMGIKDIEFKPSNRTIGFKSFATINWERVKTDFALKYKMQDDKVVEVTGSGEVKVTLQKGIKLEGLTRFGYKRPKKDFQPSLLYDLRLGVSYSDQRQGTGFSLNTSAYLTQDQDVRKFGVKGSASYTTRWGSDPESQNLSLKFTGSGGQTETFGPKGKSKFKTEYKGMLMLEVDF